MLDSLHSLNLLADDERVDGADKVSGKSKYTAEHIIPNIAYGLFVCP